MRMGIGGSTAEVSIESVDIGDINITDYHTNSEPKKVTVTNTAQTVNFTQDIEELVIQNPSGTDTIYVSLDGNDATTDDFEITAGQTVVFNLKIVQATGISLLSDNAGGTTVKLLGNYTP